MNILRVYVAAHCSGCERSVQIVAAVQAQRPGYPIEVIDLDHPDAQKPTAVFATPTYLLGDRVISLGNPALDVLLALLDAEAAQR
jgi:hypothetical protein